MQCKDIPTQPILDFLAKLPPEWSGASWFDLQPRRNYMPNVLDAMPPGTPPKLALAKMRQLIKSGKVDGCACGCRGDFRLPKTQEVK